VIRVRIITGTVQLLQGVNDQPVQGNSGAGRECGHLSLSFWAKKNPATRDDGEILGTAITPILPLKIAYQVKRGQ
jgi:hypothetical protein